MPSSKKEEFNSWIAKNYSKLLSSAKFMHKDAADLVNHVYLRVEKQDLKKVMKNPIAYFRKAMWIESTRGQFKKLYAIMPEIINEAAVPDSDIEVSIRREQLELFIERLSWFDREVFKLWLTGVNVSELARESGISLETLHTSLYRTKIKVKNAFDNIKNKKR